MSSTSHPVRSFLWVLFAGTALSILLLAGCDSASVSGPSFESAVILDGFHAQTRVDVCHLDGKGEFSKITVAEAAYDSHVAHGDGTIGSDVPGMEGYTFNDDCEPVTQGGSFDVGSAGGTFTTSDGTVTLVIPEGAVNDEIEITVVPASDDVEDNNYTAVTAFTFGPSPYQFSGYVTLTIAYDPANLPDGISGGNLRMAKLIDGAWFPLSGDEVDEWDHTVSAQIDGFSTYGVIYGQGCGELYC